MSTYRNKPQVEGQVEAIRLRRGSIAFGHGPSAGEFLIPMGLPWIVILPSGQQVLMSDADFHATYAPMADEPSVPAMYCRCARETGQNSDGVCGDCGRLKKWANWKPR